MFTAWEGLKCIFLAMSEIVHFNAGHADLTTDVLRAANVHPDTGLATDFLNPFNEYLMLAELVADGTLPADVLDDWQPIDYESHFVTSGFRGVAVVLAAYRALPEAARDRFEAETNELIDLILTHQATGGHDAVLLERIRHQHDALGELISGGPVGGSAETEDMQAAIDKMFD